MRRWTLFIIALLWLGIATTVAVAWFHAALPSPAVGRNKLFQWDQDGSGNFNDWYVMTLRGRGRLAMLLQPTLPWLSGKTADNVPSWSRASSAMVEPYERRFEYASGWPMLCLRSEWTDPDEIFTPPSERIHGGIVVKPFAPSWAIVKPKRNMFIDFDDDWIDLTERFALPTMPIVVGFVVDVAIYCLVWLPIIFIIASPASIRRKLRSTGKRCVQCNYILTGAQSDRCPECGWRVHKKYQLLTRGKVALTLFVAALMTGATAAWALSLSRPQEGPQPLHIAARSNDVQAIRALLANGIDPDQSITIDELNWMPFEWYGTTPLMWAAAHGSTASAKLLLDAGANPNASSGDDQTALVLAGRACSPEFVKLLLESGAKTELNSYFTETPLIASATSCCVECMELLLNAGASVYDAADADWDDPLTAAAREGCDVGVEFLIDNGAELRFYRSPSPLAEAARTGHLSTMQLLLDRGADINRSGKDDSPILAAVKARNLDAVRFLLDHGARVDGSAGALLWQAAEVNDTQIAAMLIEAGADVDRQNRIASAGWSPLRRAIIRDNVEFVRLLLDAGAIAKAESDGGENLFFDLTFVDEPRQFAQLLYDAGVDVNQPNDFGDTALILMVQQRMIDHVRVLLDIGADPTLVNNLGETAMDHATKSLPMKGRLGTRDAHNVDPEISALIHEATERSAASHKQP